MPQSGQIPLQSSWHSRRMGICQVELLAHHLAEVDAVVVVEDHDHVAVGELDVGVLLLGLGFLAAGQEEKVERPGPWETRTAPGSGRSRA